MRIFRFDRVADEREMESEQDRPLRTVFHNEELFFTGTRLAAPPIPVQASEMTSLRNIVTDVAFWIAVAVVVLLPGSWPGTRPERCKAGKTERRSWGDRGGPTGPPLCDL